ncbi:thiamine-phosphate kinase [Microbacterium oryzae]|uniref:thiamine-phosphate kinase n=1 Tax=Microbacterium oryzae TaxID=743009 RepID=UPI0025B26454|nr:thiamine-phosphate kinase [Microbacterium oryzae]MDN3310595.1 thiamine-phosphate kinase [Microbacterium oryzae]
MHSEPTVADLSEGEILRRILARMGQASATLLGPGDDAAVVAAPSGSVVATTDTLIHGPDFRLAWSSGYDLGWKAAAVNLSDVAAMGARPTALLVALALPGHTRVSFVEAMADGLRAACDALAPGCAVVGGDLATGDVLTVAVTALGDLEGRAPVTRSGARPGDIVAVAGELGRAAHGLELLFTRFRDADGAPVAIRPDDLRTGDADALAAQLRPAPPIGLGPFAALSGVTAMMDVSDGLVLDARRMADASRATLDIATDALGADPRLALEGGEDHALLATFPAGVLPPGFRAIGRVVERGDAPVLVDGEAYRGAGGWDPYRDWDAAAG